MAHRARPLRVYGAEGTLAGYAGSALSFTPTALITFSAVPKLGLPVLDSALCRPARVIPTSAATFAMPPLARTTTPKAWASRAGSWSPLAMSLAEWLSR